MESKELPCQRCGGAGVLIVDEPNPEGYGSRSVEVECPMCDGTGLGERVDTA